MSTSKKVTKRPVPSAKKFGVPNFSFALSLSLTLLSSMATTTEAIAAISATTGDAEDAVGRLARALRQAEGNLWPRSKRGGGKGAAHVQLPHLINLALVQGVGAEPAHAAERAQTYRRLVIFQVAEPGSGQRLAKSLTLS
jgi:hypothetical protein